MRIGFLAALTALLAGHGLAVGQQNGSYSMGRSGGAGGGKLFSGWG
jgi:hypothetical protein